MLAVYEGNKEVVKMLLAYNADVALGDGSENTVETIAQEYGNEGIVIF